MELNYDIDVKASLDEIRQTITIEGQAIDTSINENNWQVPSEDIDYFASTLKNSQLRINHGTNVEDVKGIVKTVKRVGNTVLFSAEVSGDPILLTQIEKKYLNMVSPKVISNEIVCSKCGDKTRNENLGIIHLCFGAYEVVHKPQCVELSIVAVGAYKNNIFRPKGFAAAMNEAQRQALIASKCICQDKTKCPCGISQLRSQVQSDLHAVGKEGDIGVTHLKSGRFYACTVAPSKGFGPLTDWLTASRSTGLSHDGTSQMLTAPFQF